MKPTILTGLFQDQSKAEQAYELLLLHGFDRTDLTMSRQLDIQHKPVHNPDQDNFTTEKRDLVTDVAKDLNPDLGNFLGSVLKDNSEDTSKSDSGHYIVTLHVTQSKSSEDAAQLLSSAGALHVQIE